MAHAFVRCSARPDDRHGPHRDHRASSNPVLQACPLARDARTRPFLDYPDYRARHSRSSAFDATLKQLKCNPTKHQLHKTITIRTQSKKTNSSAGIESIKRFETHHFQTCFFSQQDRTLFHRNIEIKIRHKPPPTARLALRQALAPIASSQFDPTETNDSNKLTIIEITSILISPYSTRNYFYKSP